MTLKQNTLLDWNTLLKYTVLLFIKYLSQVQRQTTYTFLPLKLKPLNISAIYEGILVFFFQWIFQWYLSTSLKRHFLIQPPFRRRTSWTSSRWSSSYTKFYRIQNGRTGDVFIFEIMNTRQDRKNMFWKCLGLKYYFFCIFLKIATEYNIDPCGLFVFYELFCSSNFYNFFL